MFCGYGTDVHAGAWTVPGSRLWAKVSHFRQTADEWYISTPEPYLAERPDGSREFLTHPAGTRRPYRFSGEYESRAVFIEGFYGVTDWLNIGVQIPYFDQALHDDTRDEAPSDAGFSDIRVSTKWRLLQKPVILTTKLVAKMPTGEFRVQDGLIPVGEGQWDYDFVLQVGRSLWPLPAYANVDVGYRVRRENEDINRDPGDEWLFNAEVGYSPTAKLLLALKLEGLRGKPGTNSFGFRDSGLKNQITYLAPTVAYRVHGDTSVEGAVRYTLAGLNFPAGYQVTVGVSTELDLY